MREGTIKYYSTNLQAPEVGFKEALFKGLAPDGGLYMPMKIPVLTQNELKELIKKDYPEIAFRILEKFLGDDIPSAELKSLCEKSYNFEVPLEKVDEYKYVLRLDQGPTASFKDFAALMMAGLMEYFIKLNNRHLTILTATSGDTGSAVANAFKNSTDINVIILFPLNEVTDIQRKQMTTLSGNIHAVAVRGKFDDCQRMVKSAFNDPDLDGKDLSSANSINIGRLLPQTVYYFFAWSAIASAPSSRVIFSVPSGNFGNLMGGIIARKMGLPVSKLIIATNSNNEVPEYLRTGKYNIIDPSIKCISNAMNVGHPSNFSRVIAVYGGVMNEKGVIVKDPDLEKMRDDFSWDYFSDAETLTTMTESYKTYGIVLEPHGAASWKAIEKYSQKHASASEFFVSLETAHPSKFPEEVKSALGFYPPLSGPMEALREKQENFNIIENRYDDLKGIITGIKNKY